MTLPRLRDKRREAALEKAKALIQADYGGRGKSGLYVGGTDEKGLSGP